MKRPIANVPASMQPVQPLSVASQSGARMYLLGFSLIFAAVVISAISLTGTAWFMKHNDYLGLQVLGYSNWGGPSHCDVVAYGDSSALTAFDPGVIERVTGLKTCNISEAVAVHIVAGSDAPLRIYLARNPPPRFLLTTWTPSDFRPYRAPFSGNSPDGLVYAAQFLGKGAVLREFIHRPLSGPLYAAFTLQALVKILLPHEKKSDVFDVHASRASRGGQWMMPLPPETKCVPNKVDPRSIRRWEDSVKTFREKYSTAQTQVFIDISPVAVCDKNYAYYAAKAAGLHDNPFERLPIGYFNQGDVHFSLAGSEYISRRAGEQILAAMKEARNAGSGPSAK